MIDNLSLGLSHGLMLLAAWWLLKRPDLDHEAPADESNPNPKPKRKDRFGA